MPRVISGKYRGIKLQAPKGEECRPSADRVKEAVFSQLSPWLYGSSFLDLFAGSGQVGIEALSRGAAEVVLVEKSVQAERAIEQNLARCKISKTRLSDFFEASEVLEDPARLATIYSPANRALELLKRAKISFDLIYFDPPWAEVTEHLLSLNPLLLDLIKEGGQLILEAESECADPEGWELISHKKYGRAVIKRFRALGSNEKR